MRKGRKDKRPSVSGLSYDLYWARERIKDLEAENAALRRERDDALLAAQIVRDLATPPISDADVERAMAEAKRVRQEIDQA